ncbi:MAG: hypothetical protein WDW36_004004 [Sanguina aurantia]
MSNESYNDEDEGDDDGSGGVGTDDGQGSRSHYFFDQRDPVLEDSQQAAAVVMRILVSYLQVLGLLQNVPLLYPNSMQQYLQVYTQITSATAVVSLDCSLPDYGSVSKATIRTLVNALAPLYVAVACWIGWVCWALHLYRKARNGAEEVRGIDPAKPVVGGIFKYVSRYVTLTNVVVVFFFYPSAIQALLNIFSCDQIDQRAPDNPLMARAGLNYGTYWRQNYDQRCYEGSHWLLAMALGIPGLICLALGWPFLNALWLWVNRDKLYADAQFTGMYGWWESVITMRKLAIAALIVFLHSASNEGLELLIITLVLGAALGLQAAYMPYEYGYMNWLEFLSLVVTTVTIYFSLYFSYSLTAGPLTAVEVVVITLNVLTLALFLYALVRANWHLQLRFLGLSPEALATMSKEEIRSYVTSFKADQHPHIQKAAAMAAVLAKSAQSTVTKMDVAMRQVSIKIVSMSSFSMGTMLGQSPPSASNLRSPALTLLTSASEGRKRSNSKRR